jgi:N,N-dimethylformamidase
MIEFDPTRLDLAREFRARPFGVHSGDLQAVLTRMRGQPIQGKHCLIMTRSYAEYALARMAGEPPRPELLPGLVFDRVEDAEWAAFKLRWRELSGQDLPLDPPLEPGAPVDASTVMPRSVLMGYAEEVSVAPGERVGFKVSGRGCPRYRADIVRLYAPDTGPDAPGFREVVVPTPVGGEYPVRWQDIQPGSYVVVPRAPALDPAGSFTLQALVWPTRPARGRQALLGAWREGAAAGYGLGLDEAGALALWLGDGAGGTARVTTGVPLAERRWHLVAGSFDAATGRMRVVQEPLSGPTFGPEERAEAEARTPVRPPVGPGPFLIAAWQQSDRPDRWPGIVAGGHFDGKIDRPRVARRALERGEIAALVDGPLPAGLGAVVAAAWDFAADIPTDRVTDRSPGQCHGTTVNLPARAVTGHNWTGSELDWRKAPEQYGAIHFHADDLDDARWETDFSLTVPADWPSGVYAARLRGGDAEWRIPFFVRPPRGARAGTRPPIAYLASTATYTVYCNNRGRFVGAWTELVHGRLTVLDATDALLLRYPELGLSTYDVHGDGSGVAYGTRLRPATNIRPTGRLWNYCADLFVIDWLEHTGLAYDVITDDDLHRDGAALLEPYRVVATGSHPEYCSREMLEALDAHLRRGGRLMYLGGNGFYWRIAYHPTKAGIIEVRRGEDGTRAWAAEVGEYYMSFTGEYGGLWRRQGRPPNAIAGVGFISQGFDASTYYRQTPARRDPRVAFMFAGIGEDELIGDFGTLRGGAAGLEIDCYDRLLGSPSHALVVASSENHSNVFELVNEAVLVAHGATDAAQNPGVRADMVFFETPNGGAVFSTGSIAYAGSLPHNGYDNNVARLTTNVLRRFADPAPFAMPAGRR